jgi:hypothetical protein
MTVASEASVVLILEQGRGVRKLMPLEESDVAELKVF